MFYLPEQGASAHASALQHVSNAAAIAHKIGADAAASGPSLVGWLTGGSSGPAAADKVVKSLQAVLLLAAARQQQAGLLAAGVAPAEPRHAEAFEAYSAAAAGYETAYQQAQASLASGGAASWQPAQLAEVTSVAVEAQLQLFECLEALLAHVKAARAGAPWAPDAASMRRWESRLDELASILLTTTDSAPRASS